MIRLKDIKIREDLTNEKVVQKALIKNKIRPEEVSKWYIYKKSIDTRKKEDIYYNYTIDLELKDKKKEFVLLLSVNLMSLSMENQPALMVRK